MESLFSAAASSGECGWSPRRRPHLENELGASLESGIWVNVPCACPAPTLFRFSAKMIEAAARDRGAGAGHQILVIGEVDFTQQHHAKNLTGLDEVMQIGAGIGARYGVFRAGV